VVATPLGPTGHGDDLADRGLADLTTIVSTHIICGIISTVPRCAVLLGSDASTAAYCPSFAS
jgi:hypothetical protein